MKYLIILMATLWMASSCNRYSNGEKLPDVSEVKIDDIDIIRFDQLVMSMDSLDIEGSYKTLLREHPYITDLYFKQLMALPSEDQDSFYFYIKDLVTAGPIKALHDTIQDVFPHLDNVSRDLTRAMKYYKYYFPDAEIPNVYAFFTEFGYQNVIFSDREKDGIGIGLDFFLGSDFDYKKLDPRNPAFSDYVTRTYNRDHIVKAVIELMVEDRAGAAPGKRFIDQMIHNGRKMYVMQRVLPHLPDTVVSGFSGTQLEWLQNNELEMWSFFLDNDMMYETNQSRIIKYLNPAPHSPGMPAQAPGRTASFVGMKIVESFMQRHPEVDLTELLAYSDMQEFLELSKYKPRRQ